MDRSLQTPKLNESEEMKKLRGKKRYYRNLVKKAAEFKLDIGGKNDWFDFWHYHFDWTGQGNKGGRERREHLKAAFTAFENVIKQLENYEKPHQVWLSFASHDSYQDALYFHTPNPNKDDFPYNFDDYSWNGAIPEFLTPFIKPEYEVGKAEYSGDNWYCVKIAQANK